VLHWTDSKFLEDVGFVYDEAHTTGAMLQWKAKDTCCIV